MIWIAFLFLPRFNSSLKIGGIVTACCIAN
jgi:hypothetical protein